MDLEPEDPGLEDGFEEVGGEPAECRESSRVVAEAEVLVDPILEEEGEDREQIVGRD